jgi:hypothetical protein
MPKAMRSVRPPEQREASDSILSNAFLVSVDAELLRPVGAHVRNFFPARGCSKITTWLQSKEAAMDAESIAGLIGLVVGLLVLLGLSIFESRAYRKEHNG